MILWSPSTEGALIVFAACLIVSILTAPRVLPSLPVLFGLAQGAFLFAIVPTLLDTSDRLRRCLRWIVGLGLIPATLEILKITDRKSTRLNSSHLGISD